jgi:hypothetical protein
MPLYISANGYPDTVLLDLGKIVEPDGGLGWVDGTVDPIPIYYDQSVSNFGNDRINSIVNSIGSSVYITGGDCSMTDPDGNNICNLAGEEYNDSGDIYVIYDTTQCGGTDYWVVGTNGQKIWMPDDVLLFHELSHAYHDAIGDLPADETAAEVQAETDENSYRAEKGYPLRDVNNHDGGCDFITTTGGKTNGDKGWGIVCIIASAAYGSSFAPEVQAFRNLRDDFLGTTAIGKTFFAGLLGEYYTFSPLIAADMMSSSQLKGAISAMLVEPFLDFLSLTELYIRQPSEETEGMKQKSAANTDEQIREALVKCASKLLEHGFTRRQQIIVCRRLRHLLTDSFTMVAEGADKEKKSLIARNLSSTTNSNNIINVLDYVDEIYNATIPKNRYVAWALLEPLCIFWSCMLSVNSQEKKLPSKDTLTFFYHSVDNWLSSVPLPSSLGTDKEEVIKRDLEYLTKNVFTKLQVRRRFGRRFFEAYKNKVAFDLKRVLIETDYLAKD